MSLTGAKPLARHNAGIGAVTITPAKRQQITFWYFSAKAKQPIPGIVVDVMARYIQNPFEAANEKVPAKIRLAMIRMWTITVPSAAFSTPGAPPRSLPKDRLRTVARPQPQRWVPSAVRHGGAPVIAVWVPSPVSVLPAPPPGPPRRL